MTDAKPRASVRFTSVEQARRFYHWRRWGAVVPRAAAIVGAPVILRFGHE